MKIKLSNYNTKWSKYFLLLKTQLEQKISDKEVQIEHIGSTAVKNLKAKPIIDILIGISNKNLNKYISDIVELGFIYIKKYEDESPNRRFFYKKDKTAHIHLVNKSSLWFKRHIAFRDELKNNIATKKEYEKLKENLSKKEWKDGNEYADAKTNFIRRIEKKIAVN